MGPHKSNRAAPAAHGKLYTDWLVNSDIIIHGKLYTDWLINTGTIFLKILDRYRTFKFIAYSLL